MHLAAAAAINTATERALGGDVPSTGGSGAAINTATELELSGDVPTTGGSGGAVAGGQCPSHPAVDFAAELWGLMDTLNCWVWCS